MRFLASLMQKVSLWLPLPVLTSGTDPLGLLKGLLIWENRIVPKFGLYSRTGPVWCKFHACKSGPLLEESLIWENRAMPKFGLF